MRFWIILLVFLAASCSKKEPESADLATAGTEAPAEAKTASAADTDTPVPEVQFPDPTITPREEWDDPGLHLVMPGKAPLRELQRTFKKGLKQTVDVNVAVEVGGHVAQEASPMKPIPSVDYVLTLETKRVSLNGSQAKVEFVVDQATVAPMESEPELVRSMEDAIEPVRGLRGRYSVDSRGRADKLEIDVPKDATSRTHQMIETLELALHQLNVPLPDEMVGDGAQWTVVRNIEQHGLKLEQRSTFEIAKIDGSSVDIRTKVEQTAAEQKVKSKGQPQFDFTLLSLQSVGMGEGAWDLTKLAPESAKSDLSMKSALLNPGRPDGPILEMEAFRESTLTLRSK
jgi:hypothetical protein